MILDGEWLGFLAGDHGAAPILDPHGDGLSYCFVAIVLEVYGKPQIIPWPDHRIDNRDPQLTTTCLSRYRIYGQQADCEHRDRNRA